MAFQKLLLAAVCIGYVSCVTITNHPKHTAVASGTDARLNCTVDGPVIDDRLSWKEHISNPLGSLIYRTDMNGPNDEIDYRVEGIYDLIVIKADVMDGGYYTCGLDSSENPTPAFLIVVEPPVQIGNTIDIVEGMDVNLGCMAKYGAPSQYIEDDQLPSLRASVGQGIVMESKESTFRGKPGSEASDISIKFNFTALPEHDGQNFTCTVMTTDPEFQLASHQKLSVLHAVSSVNIPNQKAEYQVGQKIQCMANGNPEPNYQWTATKSKGAKDVNSSQLTLTDAMLGDNEWKCSASNTAGGEENQVEKSITFRVVPRPVYGGSTALKSSATLGLLLLIVAKLF